MQRSQNPQNNFARGFREWMNPATKAPSSIAIGAANGTAEFISPTLNGILARLNKARSESRSITPGDGPLAIAQHRTYGFLTGECAFASFK